MPGPVSDSYDPEFGTGENAARVREAVAAIRDKVSDLIADPNLMNIFDVLTMPDGSLLYNLRLSVRELRVLRFALNRELESI